mmetsp:Transcript_30715/g.74709  ORF Transcript_30715/g.74709 Transcript_30715/m.74709 type:complete len:88 (+) Transcript_30715:246-509(+)
MFFEQFERLYKLLGRPCVLTLRAIRLRNFRSCISLVNCHVLECFCYLTEIGSGADRRDQCLVLQVYEILSELGCPTSPEYLVKVAPQ